MSQKPEVRRNEKERVTVRRSAEYKAALNAASVVLAEKMEEKRKEWVSK